MAGSSRNGSKSIRQVTNVTLLCGSCGLPDAQPPLLVAAVDEAQTAWVRHLNRAISLPLWVFASLASDPRANGVVDWAEAFQGIVCSNPKAVLAYVLPKATQAQQLE
jgi:hypothetical protein